MPIVAAAHAPCTSISRPRSGIFGLLLPLFLAFGLQLWESKEHSIYDQNWMPATCHIEELVITHESLYMHGDYLRNSHPNDGIYFVLQPAWRARVSPLPPNTVESRFNRRKRTACCRQVCARAGCS